MIYNQEGAEIMEITKREVIASGAIIAVMIILGLFISGNIHERLLEQYQVYDAAVKIDDEELFRYGMRTNIGYAFVYGKLETLDPVTFSEIGGEYSYIKREEQKYTRHTRTVTETYTGSDGKTHTRTKIETYWTWDTMRTERKTATQIKFLNVEFAYNQIPFPSAHEIAIVDTGYHKRNVYYATGTNFTGTMFTLLKDNTISETSFYNNQTITETIDSLETGFETIIFWVFWVILTGVLVFGFYYLKNRWLN